MSDRTKNMDEMFGGFTADPEIAGIIRAGSGKALSVVYADGRVLPVVAGGMGEGGGQGGDGGQNNAGGNGGGEGGGQKVEFSPEQQSKVQAIVDATYAKAFAKAKGESDSKMATLSAEIEKLKTGGSGAQNNAAGQGGNEEVKKAIEALTAEREKEKADRAKEKASSLQKIKAAEVIKALGKYNVLDADEIAQLVDKELQIDDGEKITVKGANGPRLSLKTGEDMALEEFLSGWLTERPHHLRSSGTQGAGSQGAGFQPGGQRYNLQDPKAWKEMPREELDKLLESGVNVHLASGQTMKFKKSVNPFLEARRSRFKT